MTDVDYCNGRGCPLSNVCQRYADYLYRIGNHENVQYAMAGVQGHECEQFQHKRFTGD